MAKLQNVPMMWRCFLEWWRKHLTTSRGFILGFHEIEGPWSEWWVGGGIQLDVWGLPAWMAITTIFDEASNPFRDVLVSVWGILFIFAQQTSKLLFWDLELLDLEPFWFSGLLFLNYFLLWSRVAAFTLAPYSYTSSVGKQEDASEAIETKGASSVRAGSLSP